MKLVKFSFLVLLIFLANSSFGQFFCPNGVRTIVNELEFEINIETNEITFDLSCDPCRFEDGGVSCECRENCEGKEEFEECRIKCQSLQNEQAEELCMQACINEHSEYLNCIQDCGESSIERNIERYAYAFNLWWTHGLTESQQGAPDESFVSNIMDGFISKITHNSTEDFENESISYCYQYEVFVEYDDGTCCRYVGAKCFQKG